jgi:hypothetical protein
MIAFPKKNFFLNVEYLEALSYTIALENLNPASEAAPVNVMALGHGKMYNRFSLVRYSQMDFFYKCNLWKIMLKAIAHKGLAFLERSPLIEPPFGAVLNICHRESGSCKNTPVFSYRKKIL